MSDAAHPLSEAVRYFWVTRQKQAERQGSKSGKRDQGNRAAITGGGHMDGFCSAVKKVLVGAGVPDAAIYLKKQRELPGFFRATKEWDLLVVAASSLIAVVEVKSQVGPSFGNNLNNRTEEALGNAKDLWTAYREGAFKPSTKPWLGYLMLLEDTAATRRPITPREPHFGVFPEFKTASYAKRYELLCLKLLRERLYDAVCFVLSDKSRGLKGAYEEPSKELAFERFAAGLRAHAGAYATGRRR